MLAPPRRRSSGVAQCPADPSSHSRDVDAAGRRAEDLAGTAGSHRAFLDRRLLDCRDVRYGLDGARARGHELLRQLKLAVGRLIKRI